MCLRQRVGTGPRSGLGPIATEKGRPRYVRLSPAPQERTSSVRPATSDKCPVILASTFGRSTKEQLKEPIGIREEEIDLA
jgi:hypothetical protein